MIVWPGGQSNNLQGEVGGVPPVVELLEVLFGAFWQVQLSIGPVMMTSGDLQVVFTTLQLSGFVPSLGRHLHAMALNSYPGRHCRTGHCAFRETSASLQLQYS